MGDEKPVSGWTDDAAAAGIRFGVWGRVLIMKSLLAMVNMYNLKHWEFSQQLEIGATKETQENLCIEVLVAMVRSLKSSHVQD